MQEWNQHGVARICHMLTVLQPALASLEGASSSDAARQFEKARLYFSLLMYTPEGLQRAIMDKPGRFTLSEYSALLQVGLAHVGTHIQGGACLLKPLLPLQRLLTCRHSVVMTCLSACLPVCLCI